MSPLRKVDREHNTAIDTNLIHFLAFFTSKYLFFVYFLLPKYNILNINYLQF